MKILFNFALIATAVSLLYKWRYRVMNTLLAVTVIRKVAVRISMNIPKLREKLLPSLFNNEV